MVFIDQMNFQTALSDYYRSLDLPNPRLDYNKLPIGLSKLIPDTQLVKTFLCAPKPDDFLIQDPALKKHYDWLTGLKNQRNFDVIEGEYVGRPTIPDGTMNIHDRTTYYKEEKGTDINIAVESITKAFNNAYDIGIFISADTDYLPVYRTLRTIGKLVVVAVVSGQRINKLKPNVDNYFFMNKEFFDGTLRP